MAQEGLLTGKTVGVDATPLEANAAMRSIVRRDTGETYRAYLKRLAQESGIETPTVEDRIQIDKGRKNKASNKDWRHPHDPDARVTKLKNGSTHMAYKAEHAVDLDKGALTAVTLHGGDAGDTETLAQTLEQAEHNLERVAEDPAARRKLASPFRRLSETVGDKGYHSAGVLQTLESDERRSYLAEPDYGRRKWQDREEERDRLYANRRRIRGERGKRLMRKRAEQNERSNAHMYNTGGMRRVYLRGLENVLKRLLVQACGFNLALVMRTRFRAGKPRQWANLGAAAKAAIAAFARLTRWIGCWRRRVGRNGLGEQIRHRIDCDVAALIRTGSGTISGPQATLSTGC